MDGGRVIEGASKGGRVVKEARQLRKEIVTFSLLGQRFYFILYVFEYIQLKRAFLERKLVLHFLQACLREVLGVGGLKDNIFTMGPSKLRIALRAALVVLRLVRSYCLIKCNTCFGITIFLLSLGLIETDQIVEIINTDINYYNYFYISNKRSSFSSSFNRGGRGIKVSTISLLIIIEQDFLGIRTLLQF